MDLLVRLYDLPQLRERREPTVDAAVRRAFAAEKGIVRRWIAQRFGDAWASESEAAFARSPVACFVAVDEHELLGFSCYDSTARGFFGPIGVAESARRRGIGRALTMATLQDMAAHGYAYAVIGGAGAEEFYRREFDAVPIPGSTPGFYRGMLKG